MLKEKIINKYLGRVKRNKEVNYIEIIKDQTKRALWSIVKYGERLSFYIDL